MMSQKDGLLGPLNSAAAANNSRIDGSNAITNSINTVAGAAAAATGGNIGGGGNSSADPQANHSKYFKEYRWFNSHSLPLEVQVGISRLEIPTDLQISSTNDIPADISITAQIISNQLVMHEVVLSTHYSLVDDLRNALVWDYVMTFPIKIKDLTVNTVITFTARGPDGTTIGGTTMHFFDKNGLMKKGKQKLIFYFGCEADTNVLSDYNRTPGDLYDNYAEWDYSFKMEKFVEVYKPILTAEKTEASKMEWLDRLTLNQIQSSLGYTLSRNNKNGLSNHADMDGGLTSGGFIGGRVGGGDSMGGTGGASSFGQSYEELDLQSFCCLVIELPHYPHAVLYEERCYSNVLTSFVPPTNFGAIAQGSYVENTESGALEFTIGAARPFNVQSLIFLADWDVEQDNLCEDMLRRMNHNTVRGQFDANIKPNLEEKAAIDIVLQAPSNHSMPFKDMDLLYRFRYSLTDNKKALTKFLMAIDWTNDAEVAELPFLLNKWKEKGPIDIADALKLLGREKCYQHPTVREYAVEILQRASNEDLLKYLLQLVQALRYEPNASINIISNSSGNNNQAKGPVPALLPQASMVIVSSFDASPWSSTSLPSTSLSGGASGASGSGSSAAAAATRAVSPLAKFLISRGCESNVVAHDLYWYLKVEIEDEASGAMFQEVFDTFLVTLSASGEVGRKIVRKLEAQSKYIFAICDCQKEARECGRRKNDKEEALRRLLREKNLRVVPTTGVRSVPLPLQPEKQISGLIPETASMFASAVYPCVIEFIVDNTTTVEDDEEEMLVTTRKSVAPSNEPAVIATPLPLSSTPLMHKIMFKSGDDLRQDQLIMQMISLMDALLKRVNLDLRLLTYGILAVSQNDGIMEFVPNSKAISGIIKDHGSITNYLKMHNPDDSGPYGMSALAMDTFVRSTAGYSVITYILGIGDRHLDNLMMTRSGQFFHIDFGFIFGQDPKLFPPPFRLTRSMVDAMGGEESTYYSQFKTCCFQAYIWLRKSANLILNLLSLMGDAGINDISKRSDLTRVLAKVEEKFRLDLTDEEAEHYFLGLINESLNSIAPKVMELAHQIAVARR